MVKKYELYTLTDMQGKKWNVMEVLESMTENEIDTVCIEYGIDEVKVTSLYNKLCELIEEKPQARSTISNKLREFATMDIIKDTPTKRGKGGRTVQLNVSSASLESVLCKDFYLESLEDYIPIGYY